MAEFYRKMLGFKDCYGVIKQRAESKCNNDGKRHFIRQADFKSFLHGYEEQKINISEPIKKEKGDFKTDVPVWFGNPNGDSLQKILVVGKEAHARSSRFNIEKLKTREGATIFAAIFGADQWNDKNGKKAIHNAYFHAFMPLLQKANEEAVCVVFTDLVKRVRVFPENTSANFANNAGRWRAEFNREVDRIKPCKIIALGQCVCCVLNSWMIPNVIYVRHPAHNGVAAANKKIREILSSIFTKKKTKRTK